MTFLQYVLCGLMFYHKIYNSLNGLSPTVVVLQSIYRNSKTIKLDIWKPLKTFKIDFWKPLKTIKMDFWKPIKTNKTDF